MRKLIPDNLFEDFVEDQDAPFTRINDGKRVFTLEELEDIRSNPQNALRQQIMELRTVGMTPSYIGSVVNLHPSTLRTWLEKGRQEEEAEDSSYYLFARDWDAAPGKTYYQIQELKLRLAQREDCKPELAFKILESILQKLPAGIHEPVEDARGTSSQNVQVQGVIGMLPPPGFVLSEIPQQEIIDAKEEMEAEWREEHKLELDTNPTKTT